MRMFVAVLPDAAVSTAVDRLLPDALSGTGWRAVTPRRRHVTLRFLADADPDAVAEALRRDLAGLPAPALRTVGAGVFGSALWLGVRTDGPQDWRRLLVAAGADPDEHVAHLTVARRPGPARARGPGPGAASAAVPSGLVEHRGPLWRPGEVRLVASGNPYRLVAAFPLVGGDARRAGADEPVGPPG